MTGSTTGPAAGAVTAAGTHLEGNMAADEYDVIVIGAGPTITAVSPPRTARSATFSPVGPAPITITS